MKKLVLFLHIIGASLFAQAQTLDADGKAISSSNEQNYTSLLRTEATSVRNISELNVSGSADAYPFLSSDGLRIYYVSSNDLYTASRLSTKDKFGPKSALFKTSGSRSRGCWLTNNDLDIYYVFNGGIYFSTRASINDQFSEGTTAVSLVGGTIFSSISFTPDKQQLYAYDNNMVIFKKTGTNQYTFEKSLTIPSNLSSKTGQLSKDGLTLYVALADITHVSKRANLNSDFTTFTPIETGLSKSFQPTVNGDQSIMIFVSANTDSWDADELYEMNGDFALGTETDTYNAPLLNAFYPNPSDNGIYHSDIELSDVSVYNSAGAFVSILPNGNTLDLSTQPKGIYMVYFKTKQGISKQKLSLK